MSWRSARWNVRGCRCALGDVVCRMKTLWLLLPLSMMLLAACTTTDGTENGINVPDNSGITSGPAFLQDDDPINKHQQYMGAGFQHQ